MPEGQSVNMARCINVVNGIYHKPPSLNSFFKVKRAMDCETVKLIDMTVVCKHL